MSKQVSSKSINFTLIDSHLNEDAEKSRNQRVADFKHIEIKKSVKEISKVALTLQLGKDLISAHLEHLVYVAEESQKIVIKILSWVHEHRIEDKTIEHYQ